MTVRWRALLRSPAVDRFVDVEIVEDITRDFVRVRTVDAYAVEWSKTPVRLELTIRRDALVGEVVP